MVENVGVAIEISLLSHASPDIQCTSGLNAAILMSVNVDCRVCYSRIGHGRKYGGSRWNFADNMFRNVIMLVYSKMDDFRRIFSV